MKKICLLLIISIIISVVPVNVIASESACCTDEVISSINIELSAIEFSKSSFGLGDIDFTDLYISAEVPVYEFQSSEMKRVSSVYLLFYNNEIVSLMYKVNDSFYQINTNLAIGIYF